MTSTEAKARLSESLARLTSARKMWDLAQDDFNADVEAIQDQCDHEKTHLEYAQYEYCAEVCDVCGKEV